MSKGKLKILATSILAIFVFSFVGCLNINNDAQNENIEKPEIEEIKDNTVKPSGDKPENTDKPDIKPEVDVKPENKPKPDVKPENDKDPDMYSYKSYYASANGDYLEYETITGIRSEIVQPQKILEKLYDGLAIDKDTKALGFEITPYNTAILNISDDIYDIVLGSTGCILRLQGIAETFSSAYNTDYFIIRVEGKGYTDGHIQLGAYEVVPELDQYSYESYSVIRNGEYLESITISGQRTEILQPALVLEKLCDGLSINKATEVIGFQITTYNTAILDVTDDIYDIVLGSTGAGLRLEGIARTFNSAFNTDNFIIRVEGKGYNDEHIQLGAYDFVPINPPKEFSYKSYSKIINAESLDYVTIKGDAAQITKPQTVLSKLYDGLSIDKNTKVLDFYITQYNTGVLNLSDDIYNIVLGSAGAKLRLQGIARTFMSAQGVDQMIIQVEGKGYNDVHIQLGAYDFIDISE